MSGADIQGLTERARKVLELAADEALSLNHNYIGTEHLLLGLIREKDGVAARVLQGHDITLSKMRKAVGFIIGRGETTVTGAISLTPRGKKVMEQAADAQLWFNHPYIGTEHILLGLLKEEEGIAAEMLKSMGIDLELVRQEVTGILSSAATHTNLTSDET